jgi:hypothetical protein
MKNTEDARKASETAIAFTADYGTDVVYDKYWKPILKELESRIVSGANTALNREQRRAAKNKK